MKLINEEKELILNLLTKELETVIELKYMRFSDIDKINEYIAILEKIEKKVVND